MDISKILFWATTTIMVLGVSFGAGLQSGSQENAAFWFIKDVKGTIEASVSALLETQLVRPRRFLQPARTEGAGVTVNARPNDNSLIFLSGFFEGSNALRLIRRDGSIVRRWPVSFSKLFPDTSHLRRAPATDWNVDLHGALINQDGSVVFNFEYSGLVKLDRCGKTVWSLGHVIHHSVEQAEGGGYWVPSQRRIETGKSAFPPFTTPYDEDLILKVSEDGGILSELSVPAILYENGLEFLLTANRRDLTQRTSDGELVHLNKVGELTGQLAVSFPMFKAGDLVLSMRQLNLVMVIDPDTRKIKWRQTGPWVRQHDPEFNGDGTLTVFNNNAYRLSLLPGGRSSPTIPRTTNILRTDPETRETQVVFGERPGQEILSVIRGKHEVTQGGGFLITEFEAGRVIETDASGNIIWEYINRYDAENVAEITEARLYRADYFAVTDWSCPSRED